MRRRRNSMSGDARELEVFISNDSQLYNSQEKPIQKNLITKMARGVYHHAGAVKLYGYLMESGAKKYVKEFGSPGDQWHQMFPPAVRKEAAEAFAQSFETEAKLGNYDNYLPKKYQGWSGRQANPTFSTRKAAKIYQRIVGGKRKGRTVNPGSLYRVELMNPKTPSRRTPKYVRASSRDEAYNIAIANKNGKWKMGKYRITSVAQSTGPNYYRRLGRQVVFTVAK